MQEVSSELDVDPGTRDRVRGLVVERGPVGASALAEVLDLTPAAVRRHLGALVDAGEIAERAVAVTGPRGRGRPAREYVATRAAQQHLADDSSALASDVLAHLAEVLGPDAVADYAEARATALEEKFRPALESAGDDVAARARVLAGLLGDAGYAASTRELGPMIQLCQGHCPVQRVAAQFPQLCESETRMISRLLGVHVQRLATIPTGGHACTTHVPTIPVGAVRSPQRSAPPSESVEKEVAQ
ncbi:helix-turn-helix transcriptional regulator [Litorihabitans aurantiacus]|uniref:Transcriptional regulator n=1 Tax=Litorihabitans aurantiacus TaxID=1930061 RepID=A0AA38CR38_9MICO|nr:transcriptional regulator [Litorihabitans aurantiacus]GMA31631.1 hypothetical protein GCM10025875_16230 [Litorihabitans aurantiacus]